MNPGSITFSQAGLWQLVESGSYRVDLDFWSRLAASADGAVLDLGCGVGRVSHHLNRLGLPTTGVDLDPGLVDDFNRTRPEGSPVAVLADATRLAGAPGLDGHRFALVIAPQQLLQIVGGPETRLRLLRGLPAMLDGGGLAAFAICEELPEMSIHYPEVAPDLREIEGWFFSSRPVAIEPGEGSVTAFRDRQSLSPEGILDKVEDEVTLDRLDRHGLEAELGEAGMTVVSVGSIPETARHMGSTLVVARLTTG